MLPFPVTNKIERLQRADDILRLYSSHLAEVLLLIKIEIFLPKLFYGKTAFMFFISQNFQ